MPSVTLPMTAFAIHRRVRALDDDDEAVCRLRAEVLPVAQAHDTAHELVLGQFGFILADRAAAAAVPHMSLLVMSFVFGSPN